MSQPSPPLPRLLLHATLSPSTLSLSQASPSSPPLTLHITARLINSRSPITILLSHSILSASHQSFYSSYISLASTTTGSAPRQMRVHGLLAPGVLVKDPESELMTFWPESDDPENSTTAPTFSIPLGPFPSSHYLERAAENPTPASLYPYLGIEGTPLAGLVAGDSYAIGLRDIGGLYPGYVWWFADGRKEEVVEKMLKGDDGGEGRGVGSGDGVGRRFEVPVVGLGGESGGEVRRMAVEMVEKPVFESCGVIIKSGVSTDRRV